MRPPSSALPPWRLFFPAAAIGGALSLALFALARDGGWTPPGAWDLLRWHGHEMLFGHFLAAFTGVLLTALPRWTGCPPVPPATTLALFALWLAARVAALIDLGPPAPWLSVAFIAALAGVAARRIIPARDLRDAPILGVLAVATLGDALCILRPASGIGTDLGLAAAIVIASVMGGRIAPALTRHLGLSTGRDLPVTPPRITEVAVAVVTPLALVAWVCAPHARMTVALLALTAGLHALRLPAWKGWTTGARPSILSLHLGYAFIPLGFALIALGIARAEASLVDAGRHAWGVGVLGLMCFAVQASVARRHGGRPLTVDRLADGAALAFLLAALARLAFAVNQGEAILFTVALAVWLLAQIMAVSTLLRR